MVKTKGIMWDLEQRPSAKNFTIMRNRKKLSLSVAKFVLFLRVFERTFFVFYRVNNFVCHMPHGEQTISGHMSCYFPRQRFGRTNNQTRKNFKLTSILSSSRIWRASHGHRHHARMTCYQILRSKYTSPRAANETSLFQPNNVSDNIVNKS